MTRRNFFATLSAVAIAALLAVAMVLPTEAGAPVEVVPDWDSPEMGVCSIGGSDTGVVIGTPPASCPPTLGPCTQIGNSCCYTCPGLPFGICIDF